LPLACEKTWPGDTAPYRIPLMVLQHAFVFCSILLIRCSMAEVTPVSSPSAMPVFLQLLLKPLCSQLFDENAGLRFFFSFAFQDPCFPQFFVRFNLSSRFPGTLRLVGGADSKEKHVGALSGCHEFPSVRKRSPPPPFEFMCRKNREVTPVSRLSYGLLTT